MKKFATLYPALTITAQAVPQLPWGHIVRLIQMIKNDAERDSDNCHALITTTLLK